MADEHKSSMLEAKVSEVVDSLEDLFKDDIYDNSEHIADDMRRKHDPMMQAFFDKLKITNLGRAIERIFGVEMLKLREPKPNLDPSHKDYILYQFMPYLPQEQNGMESIRNAINSYFSSINSSETFESWYSYLEKVSSICGPDSKGFHKFENINDGFGFEILADSIEAVTNGVALNDYINIVNSVDRYKLFRYSAKTKSILYSRASSETKERFLRIFSLLKDIPNSPELCFHDEMIKEIASGLARVEFPGFDKDAVHELMSKRKRYINLPDCTESWLEDTASRLGIKKHEFLAWNEDVISQYEALNSRLYSDFKDSESTLSAEYVTLINELINFHGYTSNIQHFFQDQINLAEAFKLRKHLSTINYRATLILERNIINADADTQTKERYIKYYRFLAHLPDERNELKIMVPLCDESWLKDVASMFKYDYAVFKKWLDEAYLQDNIYPYTQSLRYMANNNIDFISAYYLREHLSFQENHLDALKQFLSMDHSLEEKAKFLSGIKGFESVLVFHPPTELDAQKWIAEAEEKAKNYFRSKGINIVYPVHFVSKLVSSTTHSSEELLHLARMEEQGLIRKPMFDLGKVYCKEQVFGLKENIDPDKAVIMLLYGLIGRSNENILESMHYFSQDKIINARRFVEFSNCPSRKFYRIVSNEIERLYSSQNTQERIKAGENIIDSIKRCYLSSDKHSEGKTELRELVWLVESLLKNEEIFDSVTVKMQDGKLYDLADGKRLLCCAMVSLDKERDEVESLYYALDPYIGLLHIVPSLNGVKNHPIGAAILANTVNKSGENVLLVDSLEGGTLFQQIPDSTAYALATRGIVGAAKDSNSEYVMLNTVAGSSVNRCYEKFLSNSLAIQSSAVDLRKIPDTANKRQKRFLEAFTDREALSGEVKGLLMRRDELERIVR